MIKLGEYNILKVVKIVDFGVYLDGGNIGERFCYRKKRLRLNVRKVMN